MELLPDNSTAGKSLLCDTKEEEEVMFFYGNWRPPKNPRGESPPCQHLPPDEELTACAVELASTDVEVLVTTLANTGTLKTY
jgi:hypothetical protein